MSDYVAFLATKTLVHASVGKSVEDSAIHPCLFDFQRDAPRWVLDWDVAKGGRPGQGLYFCVPCGVYAADVVVGGGR